VPEERNDPVGSGARTSMYHILILEDDRTHQELSLRTFRSYPEQFRISVAGSIREAREKIGSDPPQLIISDWILPDGKGLEILPRSDGKVTIPLIIMTSYGDEHLAVEIMKSGAIDYVVKSATMFRDLPHISLRALRDWENINERRRAEEAAQESQKRLGDILSFLPDAVLAIDTDGRVIAWNGAMEQLTGIKAEDIIGKGDYAHSLPFYGERRPILVDLVLSDNPDIEKKYPALHKEEKQITSEVFVPGLSGGKDKYLWGTASPLLDAAGNRIGAIEVVRDITERKVNENLLLQREATLAALLNAPSDTIALLDSRGIILDINEEGAKRLGGSVKEITGRCAYDLLPPDVAAQRQVYIERVFRIGEPTQFDDIRSGRHLHNEIFPIFNLDRTAVDRIAIFARDTTDQKKAEIATQESEKKYRFLVDNVKDVIWQATPDLVFTYVSPVAEALIGFPPAELVGRSLFSLLTESSCRYVRERLRERKDEYIHGSREFSGIFETEMIKKDGSASWFEVSANPIFDPDGNIAGFQGISRDITDRKQAEEKLVESEEKFRTMVEASPDIIWEIDPSGNFTYLSKRCESILGYLQEDLIGKSFLSLIPPESGQVIRAMFLEHIRKKTSFATLDVAVTRNNGLNCVLEIRSVPILGSDGTIIGFRGIARDITDRKQAEEELLATREWLGIALRAANAGTWGWNFPTGKLTWSPELYELFGMDSGVPASFETWLAVLLPDDREPAMMKINESVENHTPLWNEYRIILPDGRIRWIGAAGSTVYDDAGRPVSMSGVCIDITDRKEAEELRKAYETRLDSAMEIGSLAWWEMDLPDGTVRFDNRKATLLGYSPERFRHYTDFTVLLHPEDYEPAMQAMRDHLAGSEVTYHADYRILGADGKYRWFQDIGGITSTYPDGKPSAVTGIVMDISARKSAESALEESERKFRTVADYTYDWEYWTDPNGNYLYVSPSCERITGYSADLFYRDPALLEKIIHPDDLQVFHDHTSALQKTTHTGDFLEFRIIKKDGKTIWLGHFCRGIQTPEGCYLGRRGSNRDITERKLAEEKLRESEANYRFLVDNVKDIIWLMSPDLTFTYLSPAAEKLTGYTPSELVGHSLFDILTETSAPIIRGRLRKRMEELASGVRDLSTVFEAEIMRKDGTICWLEVSSDAVINPDGTLIGFQGISRDITERKKAEEKIRESEEKFRDIFNNVNDAVQIHEIDEHGFPGRLVEVNDVACRMFGYTREEMLTKIPLEFASEEHNRPLDQIIGELKTAGHATFETCYRRKDGMVVPVEINAHVATLLAKEVVVSVVRDITERKRAEQVMSLTNRIYQIANKAGSLQDMLSRYVEEFQKFSGCEAVGIRLLDEEGNIPYQAYSGFPATFYEKETPLSIKTDECMCIYVINGTIGPELPVATPGGSFYCNTTSRFLATVSEEDKGRTRNVCNQMGYESVALIPIRTPRGIMGLVQFNDHREDMVPLKMVQVMEDVARSLWETIRRMQAEERVLQSEIRFRAIIQNSSDIIRILDREGRIQYESPSAERILGYPAGSLIGRDPLEFIHPEDLDRVKQDFRQVIDKANAGIPTEFRILNAHGEYLWVDSIVTNLLDVPGVNGFVVTTRPIQQRKQAEQELMENQRRLATAMDIADLVNWEYDAASGMFTFNDRFYALYGTTAEREGGNLMSAETYMQEFVYPADRPAVLASIQKILTTTDPGYSAQMEHRITPRDGGIRTIIARFAPVFGPDGTVIRTYGANQDITNFKLMESEIRSLNKSLEQRVSDRTADLLQANKALEAEISQRQEAEKKLQASYDEKVMLLKEIHHRVKNNLQIVASLLNLQSRYITDAQTLAAIRESQNRVKAMALVHERLYRTEDISHISLHDYIRFLGTGLFQFYDAKRRGISFTLDIEDINVDTDTAIPLGLILNELISNSLKYAFPDERSGDIAISVKRDDRGLTVEFHDTGIGIPVDLDWKNTQSLGLRLVTTLVEQLDGNVDLDRQDGTRFTMILQEKEQRGHP